MLFYYRSEITQLCTSPFPFSDGCSSCDVFCAVMNIMENMQVDNELDLFQTVRQLQVRRPEFFSDYVSKRDKKKVLYYYYVLYKILIAEYTLEEKGLDNDPSQLFPFNYCIAGSSKQGTLNPAETWAYPI